MYLSCSLIRYVALIGLIQHPDSVIQERCKTNPQEIGDKQVGSQFTHYIEPADRSQNKHHQDQDHQKGPKRILETEKDNTPKGVEKELKTKMVQGCFDPFVIESLGPDDSRRNAHHNVKNCPYGTKKPIGGSKAWFIQVNIPVVHRALRGKSRQKSYEQAYSYSNSYIEGLFFQFWLV